MKKFILILIIFCFILFLSIKAKSVTTVSKKVTTQNLTDWSAAFSWGNHSQIGYLTSESDPVYSVWDKSTDISITESQVSDNYLDRTGTVLSPSSSGDSFKADKFYLNDSGSDYLGWTAGDSVFEFSGGLMIGGTLFSNDLNGDSITIATADITDLLETPIIRNTDGDTVTIQDKLDVTGIIGSAVSLDTPEISNTAGLLKIQPDVQGDVELCGDTDVGNNDNGCIFKLWRRAPEGNDYVRMYCSASRNCYIHSSNKLTLQAQVPFTINSVTDSIYLKLGDNAGAKKLYVQDSDGNTQFQADSDGEAFIRTDLWMTNITGDKISLFDDRKDSTGMYGFGVESNAIYQKSPMLHRWYVNANADGGTSNVMELTATGLGVAGDIAVGGTVDGVDVAALSSGVSNVDNTSDADKPISTAAQTSLDLKAPSASPTFTGNVLIGPGVAHDNFHIIDTAPSFILEESDANNSEKVWELTATGGMFKLLSQSDLYTATQTVFEIDRGGTSPTYIAFPNSKVAIGTNVLSGKLTVDQASTSGGISVVTLDQGDVDEPFIEFSGGTVYGGMTGTNKYLKVKADGGGTYYIRLFN